MHWWNFDFDLTHGSPAIVNDRIMNSKDYTKSESAKCWFLRFNFEQVPTISIRNFSKPFSVYFRPGQSSLFIWSIQNSRFQRGCFNLPGVTFCFRMSVFLGMFSQTFLMKIPLCFGEASNLPLPALNLRVSMTLSWTSKTTQDSKTQSVDFLGLVLNMFRQFSSEVFPSLFDSLFSWFIVLVFLLFPKPLLPLGSFWFARSNFLLLLSFFFEFCF